jgi:hypothetical protein
VTAGSVPLALAARRTVLRRALVIGWTVLACVLVAAQAPAGVRAPVMIVFFCVVPGMALVRLVNPDSFAVELSLTVALSVALSGLTAGVLVYAHLWSPTAVVVIVAAISLAGGLLGAELGHPARHARSASRGDVPLASAAAGPVTASRHELADLLSSSSLQHFVTQRALRELNPELWFVDDLERWLRRGGPSGSTAPPTPRGVWITGVSASTSIPVAWRVLEDDRKPEEWRTRLAFEMIDALPELGRAVVAAGTAYGSLSGFRRGLEARCLPYLLRVDPVSAARALAPDRPSRSASEAREVLRERIADAAAAPAGPQANGAREEPTLVVVQGTEHLLLCEVPVTAPASALWLSNLPAETAPGRLASLVRLADRSRVDCASPEPLIAALESAAPAKGAVKT